MLQRLVLALAIALSSVPSPALGQDDGLRVVRVDQDEYPDIEVTVTLPPKAGEPRLPKDAFSVTEDGEPRSLRLSAAPGETDTTPPSVVLAIDVSGSMDGEPIDQAVDAASTFVGELPRGSEVALLTFGDQAAKILPFTDDLARVNEELASIEVDPSADTALNDGAILAAELLDTARTDLASIVLLSDGGDSGLGASDEAAVKRLRRSDATVYAVQLQSPLRGENDPEALAALAGDPDKVVPVNQASDLEGAYRSLASTLSRQYLLEYESEASGRTIITVDIDWFTYTGTVVEEVDIKADVSRGAPDSRPAGASPRPFTVTLPLLATRPAYVAGISALTISSFMIWLFILLPRRPRPGDRLVPASAGGSQHKLSTIAEWTTSLVERRLQRSRAGQRVDRALEEAGLDLRPAEFIVIVGSLMVIAFALGTLVWSPILGMLLAVLVPLATRVILARFRERRQAAFAEQLTDLLQLISGSLRAGHGLLQGIDAVARDADEPAASEFRRILVEHRLGRNLNEAMQNCADRMRNDDFGWVVQAIGIHRDVGGDLARVLDNITATIRDRSEIHREVRTLSAEGRLSAMVLTGLPFVVLIAMQLISPEYLRPLFVRPVGWLLLGLAATLIVTGTVWIRRLVKIRY